MNPLFSVSSVKHIYTYAPFPFVEMQLNGKDLIQLTFILTFKNLDYWIRFFRFIISPGFLYMVMSIK